MGITVSPPTDFFLLNFIDLTTLTVITELNDSKDVDESWEI